MPGSGRAVARGFRTPAAIAGRGSATHARGNSTNTTSLQTSSANSGTTPSSATPAQTSNPTNAASTSDSQVLQLHVTPPIGMSHASIKQHQAFLRQFAWIAVREMPAMRVGEQKKHLMSHYKAFINMYLDQRMHYTNDSFPQLPAALTSCSRIVAFNVLMQSTSKATSVFTEDALHNKAKNDVKSILKFLAEWCRECPIQGVTRQPGVFVPAEPPSGHDRDYVFNKIMQTWWRTAQCARIYKLRSTNTQLPENTQAAIRSALLSWNFAKRGVTLAEERGHMLQDIPDDPEHVYFQVDAETNAGYD
jgi:hypothetical protein